MNPATSWNHFAELCAGQVHWELELPEDADGRQEARRLLEGAYLYRMEVGHDLEGAPEIFTTYVDALVRWLDEAEKLANGIDWERLASRRTPRPWRLSRVDLLWDAITEYTHFGRFEPLNETDEVWLYFAARAMRRDVRQATAPDSPPAKGKPDLLRQPMFKVLWKEEPCRTYGRN